MVLEKNHSTDLVLVHIYDKTTNAIAKTTTRDCYFVRS